MAGGGGYFLHPLKPPKKENHSLRATAAAATTASASDSDFITGVVEDGMTFNEIKRRSAELMIPFFFSFLGEV